jgi:excisionase family DNA binding protein
MTRELLTLADAARRLGISRPTLYKWIDAECIAVVLVGPRKLQRIPHSEILRLTVVKAVNSAG